MTRECSSDQQCARADDDAGVDTAETGQVRPAADDEGTRPTGGSRPGPWRRGPVLTACALLLGLPLPLHGKLTDRAGLGAENRDPAGTARDLAASGADLLALEELTDQAKGTYEKQLAKAYPHHTVQGTVGLWSKLPLSDTRPVDVLRGMVGPLAKKLRPEDIPVDPPRALRTTVATEKGPPAVYVTHLGSVRVMPRGGFWADSRDAGATKPARAVAAEPSERVLVLGDFNGTMDDRAFNGLTSRLRSVQDVAGDGFGFSWPAKFPVARIDQILVRGVEPKSAWLLPATGSDHRPVAAGIKG